MRPEFRGLIMADYQNSIGPKAQESVDLLNQTTVAKFPQLQSFSETISAKRKVDHFYRSIGRKTLQEKRYSNPSGKTSDPPVSTLNSTTATWQHMQGRPLKEAEDTEAALMNEQLKAFEG